MKGGIDFGQLLTFVILATTIATSIAASTPHRELVICLRELPEGEL